MPIYEYVCHACDKEFEEMQKFSDDPLTDCNECGAQGQVERKVSRSAFHLKGGGWYKDGYGSSKAETSEAKSETKPKAADSNSSSTSSETSAAPAPSTTSTEPKKEPAKSTASTSNNSAA